MNTSDLILLGSFAIAVLLVIAALAVVYGRMNRRRHAYSDDGGDIFDQRFDQNDNDAFGYKDDFASIRISREPEAEPDEPAREPGPLTTQVTHEPYEDERAAPLPADHPENVVPLRVPDPEPEMPPMRRAEEPFRREPVQMAANERPGSDYDYGAAGGQGEGFREESGWHREDDHRSTGQSYQDDRMSSRGYDDENAPFVAPYVRDYIEESERRQSNRLDDLRDDVRRQLSGIREEQSNRLDLFLNSIDRKLSGFTSFGGDREEGASTRRRMDSLAGALDRVSERLSDLSSSVEQRLNEMSPMRSDLRDLHDDVLSFRRDVEANTAAISHLRENFDGLKEDFGRMERSFLERAENDQSVSMRLADVVRGTLADDEYDLHVRLQNGHTADCLIYLRGGRTKVAIDGRFPIESFNGLPSRDAVRKNLPQAKAAEDDFRRTVLRSIFACSDRCIVAGETADSAILFLPSEAAYTILHDRFPDLVRDSHRARVWLTSPSTLMGVLNLLHNVLPGEEEPLPEQVQGDFGDEDDDFEAEDAPFYAPDTDGRPSRARQESVAEEDDTSEIEARIRALRAEEEALAEELVRARDRNRPRSRREQTGSTSRRRERDEDDFEQRLERFSYDLDDSRSNYSLDEGFGERTFRSKRDDDLR